MIPNAAKCTKALKAPCKKCQSTRHTVTVQNSTQSAGSTCAFLLIALREPFEPQPRQFAADDVLEPTVFLGSEHPTQTMQAYSTSTRQPWMSPYPTPRNLRIQ